MTATPNAEGRPTIWAGHLGPILVDDLPAAVRFYEALGLRAVHQQDAMAALQLRGGTHLVVLQGDPGDPVEADFDFMVDDLAGLRDSLLAAGYAPAPIEQLRNHQRFIVADPTGRRIRIHDSHVVGPA